jgi:hypothetical protein
VKGAAHRKRTRTGFRLHGSHASNECHEPGADGRAGGDDARRAGARHRACRRRLDPLFPRQHAVPGRRGRHQQRRRAGALRRAEQPGAGAPGARTLRPRRRGSRGRQQGPRKRAPLRRRPRRGAKGRQPRPSGETSRTPVPPHQRYIAFNRPNVVRVALVTWSIWNLETRVLYCSVTYIAPVGPMAIRYAPLNPPDGEKLHNGVPVDE